ncbi:MAG: hypothetical protein CMO55_11380 [Verrucomicrobiales bacterium]|nr:hypothetical protein [Verrucomicrobiales bacterium]
MKLSLHLALLLSTAVTFISASDSYDELAEFARGRDIPEFSLDTSIIVMGPQFVDEYYAGEDGETHVVAKRILILPAADTSSLGAAVSAAPIGLQTVYEVRVYRMETKQLYARIVGENRELEESQFPLKPGDIILIGKPEEFGQDTERAPKTPIK